MILILFGINNLIAQENSTEESFSSQYIKTSDLIVEGTVTAITYFQDKSHSIKIYYARCTTGDSNGTWYAKYEITVHKLFKGERTQASKLVVIRPNDNAYIWVNGKEISLNEFCESNGGLHQNHTGIFFLKKYPSGMPTQLTNSYYLNQDYSSIGTYDKILETHLRISDKGAVKEFEDLDKLYKYIEKETGKKRVDITNKQFVNNNSPEKVNQYLKTYFTDSSASESFIKQIIENKINQINKDYFIVKSTALNKSNQIKIVPNKR